MRTLEALALAAAVLRTVCSACVGSGYYPSGSLTPSIYTDYSSVTRDWGYSDIDYRYYDPTYGNTGYQAYSDYGYRIADASYGYADYSRRYPEYADTAYRRPACSCENIARECKCKQSECEYCNCRSGGQDCGCGSSDCGCKSKESGCSGGDCGCKSKDSLCSGGDCGCKNNKCGNGNTECSCRRRDSGCGDTIVYVIETSRDDCDCCGSSQRISELKDYIRFIKD